jgi:predicted DNA binding CopG/RHH family protein
MTEHRGKQFGPGAHQFDPYDGMSDEEFVADAEEALRAAQRRQTAISLRLPEELLERAKAEARRRNMPYQTLIKVLLERSLDRLGRAS